ncbi:tautomerase family protein [Glaciimonas sp. Gout2]|uniref:tautomerase family protein n=1 Tax=unclassified Glaciimonas TaxID=2644401 RepID=UPI002B23D501|nr:MULTISPECIES: tautomerase family protein [unclassified Glaciimonas]MEB0010672.1 tautomerase family protein [Glaciimonas sp. Cout2]MEB0084794.1 tautomerase family protein [Glaciimonas sp. Gout2]
MPTYQVYTSHHCLTVPVKASVARAITRAHSEVTGADNFFAQVMFTEKAAEDYYLGGRPLQANHLFVHGVIRARSLELKKVLIEKLVSEIANAASLHQRYIWVYLSDLPPDMMVEFGHVLPQPGEEAAWANMLTVEDREYMHSTDYLGQDNP